MVLATDSTENPSPLRNWTPGSWSSSPPRIDASSSRFCTYSPVRPPMIKSTVSGGALVTSSPSDAKSTRQRGVKHSITKRFTPSTRWEVRLVSHRSRKPLSASPRIVEPQVAEVLVNTASNRCPVSRSWPKSIGPRAGARTRRSGRPPAGAPTLAAGGAAGAPPVCARAPVRALRWRDAAPWRGRHGSADGVALWPPLRHSPGNSGYGRGVNRGTTPVRPP